MTKHIKNLDNRNNFFWQHYIYMLNFMPTMACEFCLGFVISNINIHLISLDFVNLLEVLNKYV